MAVRAAVGTGILFISFAAMIAGGRDYFGYTEDHFILVPALMFVVILCVIPLICPYLIYWMGWKY